MASEAGKFKVGVFVLLALVAAVAGMLALGSGHLMSDRITCATVFDTSVQGLEIGSPVKYRGVQAGRVTRIALTANGELVRVDLEFDASYFTVPDQESDEGAGERRVIEAALAKGLRASLELTGITGMKYIECDFLADPGAPSVAPVPLEPGILYIPSRPSSLKQLERSFSQAVSRIAAVDSAGIAGELQALFRNGNAFLADPRLGQALTDFAATAASLKALARRFELVVDDKLATRVGRITEDLAVLSGEVRRLATGVNEVLQSQELGEAVSDLLDTGTKIRALVERLEREARGLDLAGTTAAARDAFHQVSRAAATVVGARTQLKRSLYELEHAVRGARRLVDVLEEDPGVLLRGKQAPAAN